MTQEQLQALRRQVMEKEFSRMNPMQREAVFTTEGPLLILAGAGSGKTTVLVNRIANIVKYGCAYGAREFSVSLTEEEIRMLEEYRDGTQEYTDEIADLLAVRPAKPWQILAITFTNKAAGELKERLEAMLGPDGQDIWASTFHSTCARILRRDGESIGYTSHFTIYDTDDSKRVMKECQRLLNIDDKMLSHKTLLHEISHAKDSLISPEDYLNDAGDDVRLRKIGEAYRLYEKLLRDADAMDFDDMIVNTVKLLEENEEVRTRYQNRFRYVMVDEYQDTNHAQYRLTSLLAGGSGNLCVVGDDDQSIYRFRGAEDLQALMMIDMDYFKQINDTYGHATGDQVLKIFAGFLKEQFRTTDIIGRVGGDEFMILMKNVRLDYSIHLHLQKLYTNLQNVDIPELNGRKLSCSIGCAVAPTDAESFSQLYRLADHALYTAKHNGRGRFVIYHDIKNQQETVLS